MPRRRCAATWDHRRCSDDAASVQVFGRDSPTLRVRASRTRSARTRCGPPAQVVHERFVQELGGLRAAELYSTSTTGIPDAPGFGAEGRQGLHCAAPAETGDVFEAVKNP